MLDSLKIAPKFALLAAILLALTGFGMALVLAGQNTQIDFAQQEARGVRYLRGVADIQREAARASLQHDKVSAEWLAQLEQLQASYGSALQTDIQARAVVQAMSGRADWVVVRAKLRGLMMRIGERSNLILDHALDSYYMMDAVLNRLPELIDRVATSVEMGAEWRSAQREARFLIATDGLADTVGGLSASLASAFDNNSDGSLKSALGAEWAELHEQINRFTTARQKGEASAAMAISLLGGLAHFDEHACAELTRMLDERLNDLKGRQWRRIGATALLFGLATWVIFMVAQTMVVGPLLQLAHAARRLAEGDLDNVQHERAMRDELGDLSRALSGFREALLRNRMWEVDAQQTQQNAEIVASAVEELVVSCREITEQITRASSTTEELADQLARAGKFVDAVTGAVAGSGQRIDLRVGNGSIVTGEVVTICASGVAIRVNLMVRCGDVVEIIGLTAAALRGRVVEYQGGTLRLQFQFDEHSETAIRQFVATVPRQAA